LERPLEGKIAVVTGSSSGIGRAIALEIARQGGRIACVNYSQSEDAACDVADELAEIGQATHVCRLDVSRPASVRQMVDSVVEELGAVDLLVNNAGIEKHASLLDVTEEDWDRVLDVNLKGAFFCLQAVARHLVRQGRGGKIINISSVHEDLAFPEYIPYACSKGGMRMLTRTAALELAPHGITVAGVAPGAIATHINAKTLDNAGQKEALERQIPLGRIGTPEDVARLVAWLASDAASYVTGATYFIDGGLSQQATSL
jgi:glucose 1-dehydrogenase